MTIPSNKRSRVLAPPNVQTSRSGRRISHVAGFDDAPFERDHKTTLISVLLALAAVDLNGAGGR